MSIKLYQTIANVPEELREKINQVKTHQSERTAREFAEGIESVFKFYDIFPRVPLIWGVKEYYLQLLQDYNVAELMIQKAGSSTIAGFLNIDRETKKDTEPSVHVKSYLAYLLPSKKEDIMIGRTKPLESIPIGVIIGQEKYSLIRSSSDFGSGRIKFS